MPLTLHTLHPQIGAKKSKKRVGRGLASKGTYSGRGVKGQRARSGVSGLQKLGIRQIMLATPKARGFTSPRLKPQVVNVGDLSKRFQTGSKISPDVLVKKGLISSAKRPVKILAEGIVGIPLHIQGCVISKMAKDKILAAGGTVSSSNL